MRLEDQDLFITQLNHITQCVQRYKVSFIPKILFK